MTRGQELPRHDAAALREAAQALFSAAGLEEEKAAAVARYLIEADLMGHTTHGLALAGWYLQGIEDGVMTKAGAPEVVSDRGAVVCWRGRRLPGAWLIEWNHVAHRFRVVAGLADTLADRPPVAGASLRQAG